MKGLKTINSAMKKTIFFNIFSIFSAFVPTSVFAQEDLLKEMESTIPKEKPFTLATFKGTRLINGHTVEAGGPKTLDFRIAHRFGNIKQNTKENLQESADRLFGLDGGATITLSLDYSFNGKFAVGVARNSYEKLYEGWLKYKLLSQTDDNAMPVTLTLLGKSGYLGGMSLQNQPGYNKNVNRLMYLGQAMVAKKFNEKLSVQLSPMFIHYNFADREGQTANDLYAVMASFRYKFTRSVAITSEYSQVLNSYYDSKLLTGASYVPTFSAGFDIETGGHVFQVFVSNAVGMSEFQYIGFNNNDWGVGQIRLGFNVSRTFGMGKRK
jgi:hypothetical protein